MPKLKLTEAAVERLKAPPGQRVEYFDATLPGFGLRVSGPTTDRPNGRKSWVLFYRFGGKQKRLTIEPPFPALKLGEARQKAGDALQLVACGKDPGAVRDEQKVAARQQRDTVSDLVESFLTKGQGAPSAAVDDAAPRRRRAVKRNLSPRYIAETRRNLENHVLPRWRDRDPVSITRRDVAVLMEEVAEKGTERRTKEGQRKLALGGPIAANRVLASLSTMFNWAIRSGRLDSNPCLLVEKPGDETKRERTLSAVELRELWPVWAALAYPFGDFFKLTLLTGQRRSEVAGMRWADVDLDAGTWTLTSEQTKSSRAHVVPLSPPAIAILRTVPRKTMTVGKATKPSPYVFTSSGSTPISGFSDAKEKVDKQVAAARGDDAEPRERWGIHDLRRTAATEMARLGTPGFIVGKVLNHAARGVTEQVYNRYEYLAEKRHALEQWGAYLDRLVAPTSNNVLSLWGA